MPSRKIDFINGNFYHIFNRGVDKRDIFLDTDDLSYFVNRLKDFNDINSYGGARISNLPKYKKLRSPTSKLVEIYAYCLLPNHFHLVVEQKSEGGISKFMQKLLTGYTHFFNKKYERSGVLFQGGFKAKEINDDFYLKNILIYVTFNHKIHNISKAFKSSKDDVNIQYKMRKFFEFHDFEEYANSIVETIKLNRDYEY